MLVISCSNYKGGVGKTTTTAQIAVAATGLGLKVLVIDMDPQGNLTRAVATEYLTEETPGIAKVIRPNAELSLSDVIVPTEFPGIELAPSTNYPDLIAAEALIQGERVGGPEHLKKAISLLSPDKYDLVIIDCPTSSSNLTVNALTAASMVLIVTNPDQFSITGTVQLLEDVAITQEYTNPDLEVAGFLVNAYAKTEIEHRTCIAELKQLGETFEIPVLEPYIPRRTDIGKSIKQGIDLANSKREVLRIVAANYKSLLKTIMEGH